jgi:hypothetical protein
MNTARKFVLVAVVVVVLAILVYFFILPVLPNLSLPFNIQGGSPAPTQSSGGGGGL